MCSHEFMVWDLPRCKLAGENLICVFSCVDDAFGVEIWNERKLMTVSLHLCRFGCIWKVLYTQAVGVVFVI